MQLSLTHNIRELLCEWITVLQEEEKQETLLHYGKTRLLLWILPVLLLYRVNGATTVHKICGGYQNWFGKIKKLEGNKKSTSLLATIST